MAWPIGKNSGKEAFASKNKDINSALQKLLAKKVSNKKSTMYKQLEYFLGFRDEKLVKQKIYGGKRLRSSLALILAEGYGVQSRAINPALAIELFHNFTLIHDDIADRDEMRRSRPTVWKLWGMAQALNAGDALSLMSQEVLAESNVPEAVRKLLVSTFIEVCEGQAQDFEMSQGRFRDFDEKQYMQMIRKKTGALFRVSAQVVGMVAKKNSKELSDLKDFGESLGVLYQMVDDYRSVWESQENTGKDEHSDIRERKKTLPILLAASMMLSKERIRLEIMYSRERALEKKEVKEVMGYIAKTSAQEVMKERILRRKMQVKMATRRISISEAARGHLCGLVEELTRT